MIDPVRGVSKKVTFSLTVNVFLYPLAVVDIGLVHIIDLEASTVCEDWRSIPLAIEGSTCDCPSHGELERLLHSI